jgi:hypothetical protein
MPMKIFGRSDPLTESNLNAWGIPLQLQRSGAAGQEQGFSALSSTVCARVTTVGDSREFECSPRNVVTNCPTTPAAFFKLVK